MFIALPIDVGPNWSLHFMTDCWISIKFAARVSLLPKLTVMNARRVHELMRMHFPPLDAVQRVWTNVADEREQLLMAQAETFLAMPFVARACVTGT